MSKQTMVTDQEHAAAQRRNKVLVIEQLTDAQQILDCSRRIDNDEARRVYEAVVHALDFLRRA